MQVTILKDWAGYKAGSKANIQDAAVLKKGLSEKLFSDNSAIPSIEKEEKQKKKKNEKDT